MFVYRLAKTQEKNLSEHVVAALFSPYRCELYFSCIHQGFLVDTPSEHGSFRAKPTAELNI